MTASPGPVALAVRNEMTRRRLRQADVAVALNLSQQSLSRRLVGVQSFSVEEVVALADHFGVPLTALVPSPTAQAVPA